MTPVICKSQNALLSYEKSPPEWNKVKDMELFHVVRKSTSPLIYLGLPSGYPGFVTTRTFKHAQTFHSVSICCYRDKHLKMALHESSVNPAYTRQWNQGRCIFFELYTRDCTLQVWSLTLRDESPLLPQPECKMTFFKNPALPMHFNLTDSTHQMRLN